MKKAFILTFVFLVMKIPLFPQNLSHDDSLMVFSREKNPAVAFVCSCLLPGLGQMYNEQVGKGFLLWVSGIVGTGLYAYGADDVLHKGGAFYSGIVLFVGSWLYSIIDAPLTAYSINRKIRERKLLFRKNLGWEFSSKNWDILISPCAKTGLLGLSLELKF